MSQSVDDQQEVEIEAIGVQVDNQPIELYKVLKLANAVSGGGEAKHVIAEGYVAVNGELEARKRRKLYDGDLIEFNQEYYLVICDAPVTETIERPLSAEKAPTKKKATPSAPKAKNTQSKLTQSSSRQTDQKKAKNKVKNKTSQKSVETSVVDDQLDNESGRSRIRFF
ncbi:RNA-binding S4 domain-containing protein [Vibrio metschnikovii]|uniref:RNA-binding S4 domain-containing protein n=1 Tax=Vibrio metschnikovii TaxID=28172 RepID=UPI001C2F4431|nr:RNA-binding S4 domain-containing protein [Vibrio metschnikovii]